MVARLFYPLTGNIVLKRPSGWTTNGTGMQTGAAGSLGGLSGFRRAGAQPEGR